jgi:hypothetical protein
MSVELTQEEIRAIEDLIMVEQRLKDLGFYIFRNAVKYDGEGITGATGIYKPESDKVAPNLDHAFADSIREMSITWSEMSHPRGSGEAMISRGPKSDVEDWPLGFRPFKMN